MIAVATEVLAAQGLLGPAGILRTDFWIKTGDYVLLKVYTSRREFLFVKISELEDLAAEHRAHELAQATIGQFMPRVHGHFRHEGCNLIVSEGLDHRRATREEILDAGSEVSHHLVRFFKVAAERGRLADPVARMHHELHLLRDHFAGTRHAGALRIDERTVAALPAARQHCDFVLTNLGVHAGELLVFDWEDYGKLNLPGFDLCVLLLSAVAFDPQRALELLPRPGVGAGRHPFVAACCSAIGIDLATFSAMLPLYLAAFLYLKQDYSVEIQDKTAAVLRELKAQRDGPDGV